MTCLLAKPSEQAYMLLCQLFSDLHVMSQSLSDLDILQLGGAAIVIVSISCVSLICRSSTSW